MNPGKSTDDERRFYRDGNSTYAAAVDWWQSNAELDSQYYRMLSKLLVKVGVSGPILWTELVKCELASETMRFRELPKATRIRCRENYLLRELDVLPHSWPIIATGRSAFKEVKQLQTGRTVIGLPHPTGSRGMFAKLFAAPELGQIQQIRFGPPGRVEWINGKS